MPNDDYISRIQNYGPPENLTESANLSDPDLLDAGYDRLRELSDLRARAAEFGGRVLVRTVATVDGDGMQAGYVYGVTFPGDFPFWRGTLEDATEKVDQLSS